METAGKILGEGTSSPISLAAIITILIFLIDMSYNVKSRVNILFFTRGWLYLCILLLGNSIATIFASKYTPEIQHRALLQAFLGVFGFQAIIKNINVSLHGKGVLTINSWIDWAKNSSIAMIVEANADTVLKRKMKLAKRLQTLPLPTLNSHIIDMIGLNVPSDLANKAINEGADEKLLKGLALANADFERASKI